MSIRPIRHERFERIVNDLNVGARVLDVNADHAIVLLRGVRLSVNVRKLSEKPTVDEVLVTLDRAYANTMRKRIKLALVLLWNDPYVDERAGGPVYAMEAIGSNLEKYNVDISYRFFSDRGTSYNWHPWFKPLPLSKAGELNAYDFVIFSTAGSGNDKKIGPWWRPMLRRLQVPFAVQLHDEAEERLLPYREEFFKHDGCVLLMPITEQTTEFLVPDFGSVGSIDSDILVYPGFKLGKQKFPGPRKKSVVTTCRLTSRKRIIELVSQNESLYRHGFSLDIHGADVNWYYIKSLKELANNYWTYHGTFNRDRLPEILSRATFHYNAVLLKRGTFFPRVELSTYEAVSYGCCPILCKDTTPDWVDDSMAVLVNPCEMKDLGKTLSKIYKDYVHMSKRFWKALHVNVNPEKKTEELWRLIKKYA